MHELGVDAYAVPGQKWLCGPEGVGALYVNASPDWATVKIDSKLAGTTPIVLSNVPAGSHTLQAQLLGREPSMQKSVIVEAGSKARVEFDFDKP